MGTDADDEKNKDGCCKMFWKFMFSHIGLCAMVVMYCVAGGFIFEHLEKANEEEVCFESRNEYIPMQDKTLENLKKVILENNLNTDAMMIQMTSILQVGKYVTKIFAVWHKHTLRAKYKWGKCIYCNHSLIFRIVFSCILIW